MIKAILKSTEGKPDTLFLGLSYGNLDRLRESSPISFDGDEIGLNINVVIHAEKDEDTIVRLLKSTTKPTDMSIRSTRHQSHGHQ